MVVAMSSQDLFGQLTPELQMVFRVAGAGYRSICPEEHFFASQEDARERGELVLARKPEEFGGFLVGIIVLVEFLDGQRFGLTTTAQFERAEKQATILLAACSRKDPYRLRKAWEVSFLPYH